MVTRAQIGFAAALALLLAVVAVGVGVPAANAAGWDRGYWGQPAGSYSGPRFTCGTSERISLQYGGSIHPVDALEAANILLVPARVFGLVGANVDWQSDNTVFASFGPRALGLTPGSHTVRLEDHGTPTMISWDLCARLHDNIAYVPLRATAEALGFSVMWEPGTVRLVSGKEAAITPTSDPFDLCPVSRLQSNLGIVAVRGQVDGPFGPGVGILEVKSGGSAEKIGLAPHDVILAINDHRVTCPRDLQEAIGGGASGYALTVVRGTSKTTLHFASDTQ